MTPEEKEEKEAKEVQSRIDSDAEKLYNQIDNIIADFVKNYDDELSMLSLKAAITVAGSTKFIGIGTIPLTIFSAVATILTKLAIIGEMERSDMLGLIKGLILSNSELKEKMKENTTLTACTSSLLN